MTRFLIPCLFLAANFAVNIGLQADEGFSSLEEQMTGKEFTEAGLDKLSQAELEALNSWIRKHSLATLAAPAADSTTVAASAAGDSDQRGFKGKNDEKDRTPITSRIVGEFSGWDGQTVFKLENGMIWAQTDNDKFWVKELENPVAVIEPGLFGSWHLHIEGYDSECKVQRIQ